MFTLICFIALVLAYVICCFRVIREDEMVVVTVFGEPKYVVASGLKMVPFLIGDMVTYPTTQIGVKCNLISVLTKETAATGSVPISLKNVSVRVQFDPGALLQAVKIFPKPPKRNATGGWEGLDTEWTAILEELLKSSAQQVVYEHSWDSLFKENTAIGTLIQAKLGPEFPCFREMKVVVGEVNLGALGPVIARQETARREALGAIVEAENYAVTTVVRAEADKKAAVLKGEGVAKATAAQVDALGGDPRNLAAIELARSGSTVVLPSGIVDAIGGLGSRSTRPDLIGEPKVVGTSVGEAVNGANEDQSLDNIEQQLVLLEAAGVVGLKDVLPHLPADQQELLLRYLGMDAEDAKLLSVRTVASMLSEKQQRIIFRWFTNSTGKKV